MKTCHFDWKIILGQGFHGSSRSEIKAEHLIAQAGKQRRSQGSNAAKGGSRRGQQGVGLVRT